MASLELEYPHDKLLEVAESDYRFKVVCAGRRCGKALDINTPIPTPAGWKTMGEIEVGDIVFDENGNQCNVIFVTGFQYKRNCYKVIFSDGSEIIADEEHLWQTLDKKTRKNSRRKKNKDCVPNVLTTKQLLDTLYYKRKDGDLEHNHAIQLCKPVKHNYKNLLIHPYVLGCWLGDGTSASGGFTTNDEEIVDYIRNFGYIVKKNKADFAYNISLEEKNNSLKQQLRELNLLNNKHIPRIYLESSVEQRLLLLQGLMDTDGTVVNGKNRCTFDNKNKILAENVLELALSMGIRATLTNKKSSLYGKDCGICWRVNFTTNIPVFKLKRKLENIEKFSKTKFFETRTIKSIIPIESVPVKCIQVDSESSLYLAGKSFIPTHNTSLSKYLMAKCLLKDSGKVTYVSPTYTMADEVWNFFYTGFKQVSESVSTQKKIIRLKNGGFFRVLSSDNIGDGFRGFSNDLIVIDEAAMIPGLSEMFFLSALPTLSDRIGKALFISTPRGNNDFYEIWKMGDPERKSYPEYAQFKDFYSWKFKTQDNPFILPSEIENAKQTMPERFFAQEYLGDFLLDGAGFFRYIDRVALLFPCDPYKGNFVFGIDFGKKNDYTVIVIMDVDTNNEVAYHRFNKIQWDWQREEIINLAKLWNPISILAEENSFGDANIEILEDLGLPIERFYTTNKSKKRVMENLSVDIENMEITLLRDKMQTEELQIYQVSITDNGNYRFGAPAGKNDDIVVALALANEARRNTSSFKAFALPQM